MDVVDFGGCVKTYRPEDIPPEEICAVSHSNESRIFSRQITRAVKGDQKTRTAKAGEAIESMLEKDAIRGSWSALKAWYKHASGKVSKPACADLIKLETEYEALYKSADPPGSVVPISIAHFDVDDLTPSAEEIEDTVRRLRKGPRPFWNEIGTFKRLVSRF
jgi:hypothetical protein